MPSDTTKLSSANAQYIARRLASIGMEAPLSILDMGCGDGTIIRDLLPSGHKLYGYDLGYRSESLVKKLADYYPDSFEEHIRIAPDERTIPFDDNSFDVIYANQVFEHVKFLDQMMGECARVLKPGGKCIFVFPTAHVWIELHLLLPAIHWLPPGRIRIRVLETLAWLRLVPRRENRTPSVYASMNDKTLDEEVFYRFVNEIRQVAIYYFESCTIDDALYLGTRGEYWAKSKNPLKRLASLPIRWAGEKMKHRLSLIFFGDAFLLENPRKKVISRE